MSKTSFGFLTLATPNDYLKAIGLRLSLTVSNPGIPVAVACSPKLRPILEPIFDHVVDEDPTVRGFAHKVHLDRYTPFAETVFFDSDVLVFRPVRPFIETWGDVAYTACGHYRTDGISAFGLDRARVMRELGRERLVTIDGAGHALFRLPEATALFDTAREVTANYRSYAGDIKYADEDAMAIAMTKHDLPPAPYDEFFARYVSALPGTMHMDVTRGECHFTARINNRKFSPCMVHFAANEASLPYTWQLWRLLGKFGVDRTGLLGLGAGDFYEREVRLRISRMKRSFLRRVHA